MQPEHKSAPIIHTFESDIKSELDSKGDTLMDVAAVGTDKKINTDNKLKLYVIIASPICFVLGAAFAGYLYINSKPQVVVAPPQPKVYTLGEYMPNVGNMLLPFVTLHSTSSTAIVVRLNKNSFDQVYQTVLGGEYYLISDSITYFNLRSATTSIIYNTEGVNASTSDTTGYIDINGDITFSKFRDVNVKNFDLRISDANNSQIVYGFVGSDYLILSTTIDGWFRAKDNIHFK